MNFGIILAAGKGLRLKKNINKALILIKNKPIFLYSLECFIKNKNIKHTILVINKNDVENIVPLISKYKNVTACIGDDSSRQKSLIKGMKHLSSIFNLNKNDVIITHDCARINLKTNLIDQHIKNTKKNKYSSTILKINDSICEIKNGCKYINRDNKYLIQTPQSFLYKVWKINNPKKSTDLFTYLNVKLNKNNFINGNCMNFKITTNNDIEAIND